MAPVELTQLSSNWRKLQAKLQQERAVENNRTNYVKRQQTEGVSKFPVKRRKLESGPPARGPSKIKANTMKTSRPRSKSQPAKGYVQTEHENTRPSTSHEPSHPPVDAQINEGVSPTAVAGRYIALDCEMVGFGPAPSQDSQLARISIVNFHGDQVYDSYVLPQMPVTDYRTPISGIRPHHLRPGYARSFEEVQSDVRTFLEGRVLVGHGVKNDLSVLVLSHPRKDIRDTSHHFPFRERSKGGTPSLKKLANDILKIEIHNGEHSSTEDARVAMLLFRMEKDSFEAEHAMKFGKQKMNTAVRQAHVEGEKKGFPKKSKKKRREKRKKGFLET
jgi:RNA exonuclease 4